MLGVPDVDTETSSDSVLLRVPDADAVLDPLAVTSMLFDALAIVESDSVVVMEPESTAESVVVKV